MFRKFIALIIVAFFSLGSSAQSGILKGTIKDAESAEPIPFANVVLKKGGLEIGGATSDFDGHYTIKPIQPGKYELRVTFVGYKTKVIEDVEILSDRITFLDVELEPTAVALEEVEIVHYRIPLISKYKTASSVVVNSEEISKMPNRSATGNAATVGGVFSKNGNRSNLRYGRSDNTIEYIDGIQVNGNKNRRKQEFNTESYDRIIENQFLEAFSNPLSTFSVDVDRASYANTRRFLNQDLMPPPGAVRIEELINYFDYDYSEPADADPFSVNMEMGTCPWNEQHQLLLVGLKGKKIKRNDAPRNNLVFLIDVSGSMNYPNKLPLVKQAMTLLTQNLGKDDYVSIVVYAGAAGLVLQPTSGREKEKITGAIERLYAGGSTAGGAGIQLAYKIANQNFLPDGNNRVILATDGDFNIGMSNNSELVRMIEEKRDDGIFLSILGFGMGNYKDDRMEQLSNAGNGNYAYIDSFHEAKKVFGKELYGTLYTIAKDVKIQIEFNPARVKSYRLIGYENRILAKEDFNDDTKDAGDIGAGHTVTALYEIIPADSNEEARKSDSLKYQKSLLKLSSEYLTLKLRYKDPDGEKSRLIEEVLRMDEQNNIDNSNDFLFASCVAEFGLLLRDSEFKGSAEYKELLKRIKTAIKDSHDAYREEFYALVKKAKSLD